MIKYKTTGDRANRTRLNRLMKILSNYGWKETSGKDYDVWFQAIQYRHPNPKKDTKRVVYFHFGDKDINIVKKYNYNFKDSIWLTDTIKNPNGYILSHPIIKNIPNVEISKNKKDKGFFVGNMTHIERYRMFDEAEKYVDGWFRNFHRNDKEIEKILGKKLDHNKWIKNKTLNLRNYLENVSGYKIGLNPRGRSPLCYRFFEVLSLKTVPITNSFEHLHFRKGKLKKDVHYIVKEDYGSWDKAIKAGLDLYPKMAIKAKKEYDRFYKDCFTKRTPLGDEINKEIKGGLGL
jgi:hypothetical protein